LLEAIFDEDAIEARFFAKGVVLEANALSQFRNALENLPTSELP